MKNIDRKINILLTFMVFAFVLVQFLPLKVLSDWEIIVKQASVENASQFMFTTNYTKNFNSKANSQRTLECSDGSAVNIYDLNYRYSTATKGTGSRQIMFYLPDISRSQKLPATCKIHIKNTYLLWNIKPVTQDQFSNSFVIQ